MKRFLVVLLVLSLMISVMAGCGKTENDSTENSEDSTAVEAKEEGTKEEEVAEKKDPVKLVINLHALPEDDLGVGKALEEVQQMDKFSHVEFEVMDKDPDYKVKMPISVASGEQLDIIVVNNSIHKKQYATAGTIQPLDELIAKAGVDFDEMFGSKAVLAKVNDETVAVPVKRTDWMLYYNKAIFDEAGIAYPDPKVPMTWDEYSELAANLASGEGATKKYGALHMTWPMFWYGEAIMKLGGAEHFYNAEELSNIEDPIFAKALERTYNMMHVDKSIPTHADITISKINATGFMNGKYGMMVSGSWILSWGGDKETYPRDWKLGIAPLPVDEGTNVKTWGDMKGYGIPATSADPETAFEVIMEMTKLGAGYATVDPHAYQLAKSDQLFVEAADKLSEDSITKDDIAYLLDNPDAIFCTEKIVGPNDVEYDQLIKEEVEKYFVQEQDLDTTIANIKERGNKAIQAK